MPFTSELISAVVVFFVLLGIRRRREGIRHWLRWAISLTLFYGLTFAAFKAGQFSDIEAMVFAVLASLVIDRLIPMPRRSRYLPASVRRRAIARFERTGRRYDSAKHDLDHIVPYARGGSNTADNIAVRERRANRSKGKRAPWWDIIGKL